MFAAVWLQRLYFFFFQAEDGIRYSSVTGVQTCALPISDKPIDVHLMVLEPERYLEPFAPNVRLGTKRPSITSTCSQSAPAASTRLTCSAKIGRASCRERV